MSYEREMIFILVKTYPTLSKKYIETVCTAGIKENGDWIRLYPIPFRLLKDFNKYHKYSWINVKCEKNTSDFRPESYRVDTDSIIVEDVIRDWELRRKIIEKTKVYTNLKQLIDEAKDHNISRSLALFKPKEIIDFVFEETEREYDSKKVNEIMSSLDQTSLFEEENEMKQNIRLAKKIPYKMSYVFTDDEGKKSKMMIEDWEIGMLFLNCLKKSNNNEKEALEKVKQKYYNNFNRKDLYFCLGTTKNNHYLGKNPFIIIGVIPFPKKYDLSLF